MFFLGYNYKQFDTYVLRDGGICYCTLCDFKNNSVTNVRYHIECKHYPGTYSYPCPAYNCGKILNSKSSYRHHIRDCKILKEWF